MRDYNKLSKKMPFTAREMDVIACLVHGRSIKKIAVLLAISPKTVESHVRNIMLKTQSHHREELLDKIQVSLAHTTLGQRYRSIMENHLRENPLKEKPLGDFPLMVFPG